MRLDPSFQRMAREPGNPTQELPDASLRHLVCRKKDFALSQSSGAAALARRIWSGKDGHAMGREVGRKARAAGRLGMPSAGGAGGPGLLHGLLRRFRSHYHQAGTSSAFLPCPMPWQQGRV